MIGVENIVATLIPVIFIILLNAVVWALLILFTILFIWLVGVIIFNFLFSGRERSQSSYRVQSPKAIRTAADTMTDIIDNNRKVIEEYETRDRMRRAGWP